MELLGKLHGYRWMYNKCKLEGLNVCQRDVRIILGVLDPEGCAFRQVFQHSHQKVVRPLRKHDNA